MLRIFHHTFQTLVSHHFLTEDFRMTLPSVVLASRHRDELAERLAALDSRAIFLAELRTDFRG